MEIMRPKCPPLPSLANLERRVMKTVLLYNKSQRSHMIHSEDLISGHNPQRQRNPLDRKWDWIDPDRTVELPAAKANELIRMFPKDFKKVAEMDPEQSNEDVKAPEPVMASTVTESIEEETKPKAKRGRRK